MSRYKTMTSLDKNTQAFFALVRAGLWADANLNLNDNQNDKVDWEKVYQLAEEQSVVGLVLAGIERLKNDRFHLNIDQELLLQWIGEVQIIEQQNKAMNEFVSRLFDELNKKDIDAVLIKGQGVAQCYVRPMWRSSGDVDFLLNKSNYEKGKVFLDGFSNTAPKEYDFNKEYCTTISGWVVELHGSLRCGLSAALNRGVDEIQRNVCDKHKVRYWDINYKSIPLPEENNDALLIFTHFIKHFYKGELGIRQICDWCRLLWTYRDSLNHELLESRLNMMGLKAQWKGFGAFAVDYLGMPSEAMPLYSPDIKWSKKADKICAYVLKVGNFGHNIDGSYYLKYPLLIRKSISMWKRTNALFHHASIFPLHTFRFLPHVLYTGLKATIENGSGVRQQPT